MKVAWPIKTFADVLEIRNGRNQRAVESPEGAFPILGSAGKVMGYATDYICEPGTTIIGRKGTIDTPIYVEERFWNVDTAFGLSPSASLHPKFLNYFCQYYDFGAHNRGTTIPSLVKSDLLQIAMPVPSLGEQQRIVAALDEAFAAIASATANAEKNLANAREMLLDAIDRELESSGPDWTETTMEAICSRFEYGTSAKSLPTGSVPVLRMGNLQNGEIDWSDLVFTDDPEDIAQLSLRPMDVLFNRTNSLEHVGKSAIVRTDRPAVFAGYLIRLHYRREAIDPEFLNLHLNSRSVRAYGRSLAGKSVNQANISAGKLKTYSINLPPLSEQSRIVSLIANLRQKLERLQTVQRAKIERLTALKQSLLYRAFTGELTASRPAINVPANDDWTSPEASAQVLVFAHFRHAALDRISNFGHVKAQKSLQAVEAWGGLDLGREPIKDRAGPNDFPHMRRVEEWAKQNGAFEFVKRPGGGYDFRPLQNYSKLLEEARRRLDEAGASPKRAIELLVDMDSDWAEIIVTTHAAWNNLILDQAAIADDLIVYAARDGWHPSKLRHEKSRFHDAIRFLRSNGLVPDGSAKRVGGQEALLF